LSVADAGEDVLDKTLITHGRTQKALFLGYDLIVSTRRPGPPSTGASGCACPRMWSRLGKPLPHGTPWFRAATGLRETPSDETAVHGVQKIRREYASSSEL
jgi:hypothetical protein